MNASEPAALAAPRADVPLFVDLDGTLVLTDLLYESFLDRLKRDWWLPLRAFAWLAGGRAALKTRLAEGRVLSVDALPYHAAVLAHIRDARAGGRRVYLATASHLILAQQVADHLGLFDGVIASEPGRNVSGDGKLARLREVAGSDRFEYLGNSAADVAIWDAGAHAGVVAPDAAARRWMSRHPGKARALGEHLSPRAARAARLRLLRPRRWPANLLLALPLLAAPGPLDAAGIANVVLGIAAFSLCTSALAVIDDLLDLDADRAHPRKRGRPFASGAVPLAFGFHAVPLLLAAAFGVGAFLSAAFVGVLAACFVVALAHSLSLRRTRAIDALALAVLLALRIVAGAVASHPAWPF
jgi:phosphoserine phosphatase